MDGWMDGWMGLIDGRVELLELRCSGEVRGPACPTQ